MFTGAGDKAVEEKDKIIVGALKGCSSRVSVEDTFDLYSIEEKSERIDKLNICMGNPQTFFSNEVSVDAKYELTIQLFLTGSWKLSEIYDRIGVGV
jgi:hypothetical protein